MVSVAFMIVLTACGASGANSGAGPAERDANTVATTGAVAASGDQNALPDGPTETRGDPKPLPGGTEAPDENAAATTSAPSEVGPVEPLSVPADGSVFANAAVVGCSQTRDAIFGYNEVATDERFGTSADAQYLGGGSIEAWANAGSRYWRDFDQLAGPDNDAIWLMICWHSVRSVDADVAMVEVVIDEAMRKIGRAVPVYVSGLNDWDPRSLCPRGDFPASAALADDVVAAGLAERGPDLGPLHREHTDDGCHGNRSGNELMGHQLVEFFG
jgi:hypothetical protein